MQPLDILVAAVAAAIGLYIYETITTPKRQFPRIPWVGRKDSQLFSLTRATIASFTRSGDWLAEGYRKVSCHFMLQSILTY